MPLLIKSNTGLEVFKVPRRRQTRGKSGNADEYLDVCVLVVALYRVVEDAHLLGSGERHECKDLETTGD